MCGFPGLAMFSLLEGEGGAEAAEEQKSNFKQVFLHAVETMLPYTTPYVYPGIDYVLNFDINNNNNNKPFMIQLGIL